MCRSVDLWDLHFGAGNEDNNDEDCELCDDKRSKTTVGRRPVSASGRILLCFLASPPYLFGRCGATDCVCVDTNLR